MSGKEDCREHLRTPCKAQIKLWHSTIECLHAYTIDISDGGIFALIKDGPMPEVGAHVWVQIQGLPIEGPINAMEVTRVNDTGVGLKFMQSEDAVNT